MSLNETRARGDTYPMEATLKVNGVPVNLIGGTVAFSAQLQDQDPPAPIKKIDGDLDTEVIGHVTFTPLESTFDIAGVYKFDVERVAVGGEKSTHILDFITIEDDVTK